MVITLNRNEFKYELPSMRIYPVQSVHSCLHSRLQVRVQQPMSVPGRSFVYYIFPTVENHALVLPPFRVLRYSSTLPSSVPAPPPGCFLSPLTSPLFLSLRSKRKMPPYISE